MCSIFIPSNLVVVVGSFIVFVKFNIVEIEPSGMVNLLSFVVVVSGICESTSLVSGSDVSAAAVVIILAVEFISRSV